MDELRREFEELLGYKPHHKLGEKKLREKIDEAKEKAGFTKAHETVAEPVVEVEAPPIEPLGEGVGEILGSEVQEKMDEVMNTAIDTRTPEQIEEDIIAEAVGTVPEFIPLPEEVKVTEEQAKEMQATVSDNPLMAAMSLLLNSQTRTNELLEKMNDTLAKGTVPVSELVTPPEALANLTKAQQDAPLLTKKIYKIQILKMDLVASDGGQDRSEAHQIFQSREDAQAFGEKFAPGLSATGTPRYRVYHESIILPSNTPVKNEETK